MTANEFAYACVSRTIPPELALENEKVRQALMDRDDAEVCRVLEQEF